MRALLAAALAVAGLGLSACSSSDSPAPTSAGSSAGRVGWSPCDGLTAARVGALVGTTVTENDGSPAAPRCAFLPRRRGEPGFEVNYLWFDGGLGRAWDTMGKVSGTVRRIRVPGADAARLVVNAGRSGLLVSGFVQTEGLVQSVNAADVPPYDRGQVVAGTRALLAELARRAPAPRQSGS